MSHNSDKNIAEGATGVADLNVFMEAIMSEMRHVMREMVQPRGVRDEDEEYYGAGFDEWDLIVGNRRHGGRFREARIREDNSLGRCFKIWYRVSSRCLRGTYHHQIKRVVHHDYYYYYYYDFGSEP
ncbi:hypothetical protein TIFTF001_026974 [Ficus carica]|uniref:Uncharacterized protein n=1 Tax=Ficus carica TaxID=3494 RepID=A0AA88IUD4_FICCA|nr:hypothetical protein TIFTF001_026974 [Ficus carica]